MAKREFEVTAVNAGPAPFDIDGSDGNDTIRIRVQDAPYPPAEVGSIIKVEWVDAPAPVVEEPVVEETPPEE